MTIMDHAKAYLRLHATDQCHLHPSSMMMMMMMPLVLRGTWRRLHAGRQSCTRDQRDSTPSTECRV